MSLIREHQFAASHELNISPLPLYHMLLTLYIWHFVHLYSHDGLPIFEHHFKLLNIDYFFFSVSGSKLHYFELLQWCCRFKTGIKIYGNKWAHEYTASQNWDTAVHKKIKSALHYISVVIVLPTEEREREAIIILQYIRSVGQWCALLVQCADKFN